MQVTHSHSGEELKELTPTFVAELQPRRLAVLVTLSGELGAGKTMFVQGIAVALGVKETVASPTFVIEKIYKLENQKWERLVHIDAYRLKGARELEVLGWKELLADSGNLILLEWPERVAELIPESAIRVRIDIDGDGRIIFIDGGKKDSEKI